MKICFPIAGESHIGLDSEVYGHFGSAPRFMVVDSVTREIAEVINRDRDHAHGSCNPLRALGGSSVDAVVVGGIGRGALMGLLQAGLKVYQGGGGTIADNLVLLEGDALPLWNPQQVCGAHGGGHGCGCR